MAPDSSLAGRRENLQHAAENKQMRSATTTVFCGASSHFLKELLRLGGVGAFSFHKGAEEASLPISGEACLFGIFQEAAG